MDGRPTLQDEPLEGAPDDDFDAPDRDAEDGSPPRWQPNRFDLFLDRIFDGIDDLREGDLDRTRRVVERVIGIVVITIATWAAFEIINPELNLWPLWRPWEWDFGRLFSNTTTNGGDMGAHVWWPNFLAENWFPKLRLSGWAPDWYAGFPAGHYYFPLPAVLIAILDAIPGVPYNVAFKLISVSGVVMLPAAGYSFARGMRAPWPAPPAFAIAAFGTLVQTRSNWQIYGGNIASTLAGEFSFTIALSLGLFGLGALGVTLHTGRRRWLAPLLLALAAMSHVVVALFVGFVALLIVLTLHPKRTWRLALPIGATAVALTAVWSLPLIARHDMTQSMRYAKELPNGDWQATGLLGMLPGPLEHTLEGMVRAMGTAVDGNGVLNEQHLWLPTWVLVLCGIAIIGAGWYRRRVTLVLLIAGLTAGIAFVQWLPYFAIWNTRFLPFWLLCAGFLAAMGATEIAILVGNLGKRAVLWIRDGDLFDARARAWSRLAGASVGSSAAGAGIPTLDVEACTLLRVRDDASEAEVDRAFQQIVSDADGQDVERFRRLSDAYALLREQARARDEYIDELEETAPLEDADDYVDPALRRQALEVVSRGAWDRDPPGWTRPYDLEDDVVAHRSAFTGFVLLALFTLVASIFGLHRAWDARDDNSGIAIEGWAKWNYSGYEDKPAWPEYSTIMSTMADVGKEHGCGRLLWEPKTKSGDSINVYGTSLALELLPHFTDGCIGSMEGLYFESAATTSFHFLTVSELTPYPSNPVRSLKYGTLAENFDRGVKHMQMLGVKYYMAATEEAYAKADAHPDLTLVAEIPDLDGADPRGWRVYEVAGSELVEGLATEPVVADIEGGKSWQCFDQEKPAPGRLPEPDILAWECAAAGWWGSDDLLDSPWVEDGPDEWKHVAFPIVEYGEDNGNGKRQRIDFSELTEAGARSLPKVEVTEISEEPDEISFHVDQTGVPVVVKASFFPNWEADGAKGPYRLAPNLMVVIPTENDVTLTYGLTPVDWLGRFLTIAGIAGLILLARWKGGKRYAADAEDDDENADRAPDAAPEMAADQDVDAENPPAAVGADSHEDREPPGLP